MAFGYHFATPDDSNFKHRRRELLDQYGQLAQLSAVPILIAIQIPLLITFLSRRGTTDIGEKAPSSPYMKHRREKSHSLLNTNRLHANWTRFEWWTGNSIVLPGGYHLGTVSDLLFGGSWFLWLLFLCMNQTGSDYLHLTKRFGIVGASQLPLHYLLAVKSPYSPLQLICRMSHEQLNQAHRVLGRIVQALLTLHALFYLNFYVQMGFLARRVKDIDVIIGLLGITLLTILSTSALGFVRARNYRVFYFIHIAVASIFLPLMYFHVHHVRVYILEAAAVYLLHVMLRFSSTKTYPSTVSMLPGTNLVRVEVPFAPNTGKKWKPGQHVYLRLPSSNPLRSNPFTIASVKEEDSSLHLIARALKGNTQRLAAIATGRSKSQNGAESAMTAVPVRLSIEGPYGASAHLPDLLTHDRILLIAGGVGATFIIPIWRSLLASRARAETVSASNAAIKLVWSVRTPAEVKWAFSTPQHRSNSPTSENSGDVDIESPNAPLVPAQTNPSDQIQLYFTGAHLDDNSVPGGREMELASPHSLQSRSLNLPPQAQVYSSLRPPVREIVDEAFAHSSSSSAYSENGSLRVAVLVCGPPGMGAEVRRCVGKWVGRGDGMRVFYHAEEFGL